MGERAVATFGAGCFWGVQRRFDEVNGVVSTEVGYQGGTTAEPTYQDVCGGDTGHAEVVRVEFDPGVVSYGALLELFWTLHDPTQLNRQGPDVGDQYRSAVFVHDAAQRSAAEASKAEQDASGRFGKPIVTVIEDAGAFHRAEDYHQKYLEKRGAPACNVPGLGQ